MFAIETDLGRFEADTERDAKKLLAKAKRERKKQEAEAADKRAHARLIAGDAAGRVLGFYVEKRLKSLGWRYYPANHRYCPAQSAYEDLRQRCITIDTENGKIRHHVYGVSLVGAVMNGCGYCQVVFLADDTNHHVLGYTVGLVDGQYSMVQLPECVGTCDFVCGKDE